jgi:hypothetical protein
MLTARKSGLVAPPHTPSACPSTQIPHSRGRVSAWTEERDLPLVHPPETNHGRCNLNQLQTFVCREMGCSNCLRRRNALWTSAIVILQAIQASAFLPHATKLVRQSAATWNCPSSAPRGSTVVWAKGKKPSTPPENEFSRLIE